MLKKTTSSDYLKYGIVTSDFKDNERLVRTEYTITDDTVRIMYSYDRPVYIEPMEGMAMLRIVKQPEIDNVDSFALHRSIRINPGNYFDLVPMAGHIIFNLYAPEDAVKTTYRLSAPISYDHIVPHLIIKEILAYYYVVKRPGYMFHGEVHNFYEFTYVDHGSLDTMVDGRQYHINGQQCMIYGPGQFHDQKITSNDPCSYMTIIFDAKGIQNEFLLNRVFSLSRALIVDVEDFVKASEENSSFRNDAMIAALQYLLVAMQADYSKDTGNKKPKPSSPINQHYEDLLMEEIVEYITKHLSEPLPVEQICTRFSISRSALQHLFRNNLNISPKQYINNSKLAASRILIRSGEHSISDVASMLGFNSIHYFSRKFTAYYGLTPSEYARNIYDMKNDGIE